MATAPTTETPLIDPVTGRLRPMSIEERRERSESLRRALDEMAGIVDETDTDDLWADVFSGLEAARGEHPDVAENL